MVFLLIKHLAHDFHIRMSHSSYQETCPVGYVRLAVGVRGPGVSLAQICQQLEASDLVLLVKKSSPGGNAFGTETKNAVADPSFPKGWGGGWGGMVLYYYIEL